MSIHAHVRECTQVCMYAPKKAEMEMQVALPKK